MTFAIFDKLGGEERALGILERRMGKRPGDFAVRAWKRERKLPSWVIVELMFECQHLGIPVNRLDTEIMAEPRRRRA